MKTFILLFVLSLSFVVCAFSQSQISVVYPNGDENFLIDSNYTIRWQSTNITYVDILMSTNAGDTSWSGIAYGVNANLGQYLWHVPNTPSNICKVKIRNSANPQLYDITDGVFCISNQVIHTSILADTIWKDSNRDGLEVRQVNSFTTISYGNITAFKWIVNGDSVASIQNPYIQLMTGTNVIKLIVRSNLGVSICDSIKISVYVRKYKTGGAIISGVSQIGNWFYVSSQDKGIYKFSSGFTTTDSNLVPAYITGGSIQSTLCISSKKFLYVGSDDMRLYCFDTNLTAKWDVAVGGLIRTSPSVSNNGNTVYLGTENGLFKALDANNGNSKWTFQTDGSVISSPAILETDSKVLILFGTTGKTFYALEDNGNTYSVAWTKNLGDSILSSPALYADRLDTLVYVGCKDGYLYRFNCSNGFSGTNNNWKIFTGAPINRTSPIIDNNRIVYISSSSGNLYGYNYKILFNSNPIKRFYQNYDINGTPGIGPDGTIFIGCDNGKFFALERGDSSVLDMSVKWFLQNTSPVIAPTLVTDQGWVFIGTSTGDIYFMVDPSVNPKKNSLFSELFYYWPTFKGSNLRTGNFKNMPTHVNIKKNENVTPAKCFLYQNYPNPFNSQTIIKFDIHKYGNVIVNIYDITGKEIDMLFNGKLESGAYILELNLNNYSSGIYFYSIKSGDFTDTKRMVLIK